MIVPADSPTGIPAQRRVRTQAERDADGTTLRVHDSDAWETVSGWVFGCRTCLEHQVYDTQSAALARKQVHDSRALPWWVARINQESDRGFASPEGLDQP